MLGPLPPLIPSSKTVVPPKSSASASASAAARGTLAMAKSLDESEVGISCYVSSLPGFHGVLKQRYCDFIVNEVDRDSNIVRLSSFDLPPEHPEDKEEEEENPPPSERAYTDEIESFRLLAGESDAESLKSLLQKVKSGTEDDIPPIVLSVDSNKSHRAEVHNFFKKNFKFLVTDTVEGADGISRCIRVRFSSGEGGGKGTRGKKRKDVGSSGRRDEPFDSRGSDNWPNHLGKFLRFHLYKENKDTQEALGVIGKMLGIQQRSFGFAGTKDKRSISTQRVTIFKQHAKRLAALNSRLLGMKVGDFCYVKEGLMLGQLFGNRFTITLRGVVADSQDTINAAVDGLERNGFINYYGLQRFGSGSVATHLIGASLLRGEWKSAAGLILDPRGGERVAIREARDAFKGTGDIDFALRQLPRFLVAERAVLQCLKKCPGNYLQALKAIPRTLRMIIREHLVSYRELYKGYIPSKLDTTSVLELITKPRYVHSYQSYLWNHAASKRVQKYGIAHVVLGDLVFCKEDPSQNMAARSSSEIDEDCIHADNPSNASDMSNAVLSEEKFQSVKVVNSDDLLTGGYTFEDVVLPLPGSRIIYPENDIAGVYHDMAKQDGISLTESAHGAKEFSITRMTGSYRRVFQRPIDFTWELLTYTDSNVPLAETDLDIMLKTWPVEIIQEEGFANGGPHSEEESEATIASPIPNSAPIDGSGGKSSQMESSCNFDSQSFKMALKLGFILPASCYATMAIRELLKASTSLKWLRVALAS